MKCTSCNNPLIMQDELYHCNACGAIYEPVKNKPTSTTSKDYKVLFFTLVEHNINKLFGFYLMILFLLSMLVYTFEYASGVKLAWYYVIIQIFISGAFFYSSYKLGEEKCKK